MLHFNGIEPVELGGVKYKPTIDAEKRLRLSQVDYSTINKAAESDDAICACFEDEKAQKFIRERLTPDDKIVLGTYLNSGETGLNRLSDATNKAVEKYIERVGLGGSENGK